MSRVADPIETVDQITPSWLEEVLGCPPVASVETTQIGTGQMSENHRVSITYAEPAEDWPATLVAKVAASDQTSRQTGLALGLYEREVHFYRELAPKIGGPLAPCHHAAIDEETGAFCLLLGDAGPAEQGDDIAGCDLPRARLALAELGRLHGPVLGDAQLAQADWLNRPSPLNQALIEQLLAGFLERYQDRVSPEHRAVAEQFAATFDAAAAADEADTTLARGLVHGDYRLDNLLFGEEGADRPLTVVDWQTTVWGPAMTDVAYFLGCALTVENRRAWAEELLGVYHAALGAPITLEQVRDGVRRASFFGVMMSTISPMMVQRTERGDDMFMATFARHCQQALDLDAPALLPEPTAAAPLSPEPSDEGPHARGDDPLWNESWYFDVADPEQGIGAYFRLGLEPGKGSCWNTTLICGPGRPTVALVDFAAPLPDESLTVTTEQFASRQVCEEPLTRYRVTVHGTGESHADPAALLRQESGDPVAVRLDLVWETAGTPFQYRLATRYEIPCRVYGTLTVGDETFTLNGAAGQRDHSWGARDWWSMDWVWSAYHLDDGTHLHGLDLRIPDMPRMGTGYAQAADGALAELAAAPVVEQMQPDGLGASTRQTFGDVETTIEPLGHGPLRIEATDGRVAMFPRAWGRVSTGDGRTGVGWIEWNLNLGG